MLCEWSLLPTSILKGWEHERQPECLSEVKSWIISEVKLQRKEGRLKASVLNLWVMIPRGSGRADHTVTLLFTTAGKLQLGSSNRINLWLRGNHNRRAVCVKGAQQ